MGYAPHPVHLIYIQSKLVTGFFPVTVCPALLVQGITLLMVNDVAGKVTPALDVLDVPQCRETAKLSRVLFPSCVVTCAQARKSDTNINTVSLSNSFWMPAFSGELGLEKEIESPAESCAHVSEQEWPASPEIPSPNSLSLSVSRERLCCAKS